MDIYSALSLKIAASKVEPDVWVRRMVIYQRIGPEAVPIREIKLTKGVNIVWAEESEDEQLPVEITGHSAGKTSFCRLLRYALGEKTYGTKANMELIQRAFPDGYLGAELVVRQQAWAVVRPLGNNRYSYLKAGATIEELLTNRDEAATQDDYPVKLGLDALLDELEAGAVLRTNKAIQWGHLLAWCTRDQEARFQNCYDWRSPRSESDWPSFRSSKADPLFVMRTILGLFLPNELKGEEELAALVQAKEKLENKLPGLRREPQFRINLYEQQLRRRLREVFPDVQGIESLPFPRSDLFNPSLDQMTDAAMEKLASEVARIEEDKRKVEDQIETIGGRIGISEERQAQLDAMFNVDAAGQSEMAAGAAQRQQDKQRLEAIRNAGCWPGGILYKDCPQVQERQRSLRISVFQDAQALATAAKGRAETQRGVDGQRTQLRQEIATLQDRRKGLREERKSLEEDIQKRRDAGRELTVVRDQLTQWLATSDAPDGFSELSECQQSLRATATKIERLTIQLNDLLAQHDTNRKLLSSIFSAAVHGVLPSGNYDGQVSLANRELSFHITRGATMSGEAVETLAVLLADLSCMVYNSVSEKPRLPGFLLHDSPREADLSLGLYRRFITLTASLQKHFESADACPFQYIITTTTPPPESLRNGEWVKLHLNAAIPDESLFRRSLALDTDSTMPLADALKTEPTTE